MHITLINPPTIACVTTMVQEAVPPLGLAYLTAAIRAAGFGVSVVDAVGEALGQQTIYSHSQRLLLRGLTTDEIIARIRPDTDAIGVSSMFSDAWCPTRDLIVALRRAFPKAVLILGGEHATACADYILDTCPAVDHIVRGEGEATIVSLLDALESGTSPSEITGVTTRTTALAKASGLMSIGTRKKKNPRIRNLDTIARPSWDDFPIEQYIAGGFNHGLRRGRSMPILASRGCPYQCTFCSSSRMWTTRWSVREASDVIDEMKGYIARFGVNDFTFYDLTAIISREWIVELCERMISEGLNVTWQLPSGTRSEAVDDELAALIFRAGCRNLNFAPESGSPTTLERIKKRVKIDRLSRSVKAAVDAGIEVKVNIIVGFPHETMKEVLETARFVSRMAALGAEAVSVYPFCAYPGSELFDELIASGKIRMDDTYFENLVFTDYGRVVSYSDHFDVPQIRALLFLLNASFYGTQLVTHTKRFSSMAYQVVTRQQSGKVSNAVEPMRQRQRVYREIVEAERAGGQRPVRHRVVENQGAPEP